MKHLFAFLLCAAQCWAAETNTITFTNKSGVVVKDAPVTKVLPEGILYRLPGGGGKVMFTNLPTEVQLRFGFDAVEWAKKQEEARLLAGEQAARRKEILLELQKEKTCFIVNGKLVVHDKSVFEGALSELSGQPAEFHKAGFTFNIFRDTFETRRGSGDRVSRIGGGGGSPAYQVKTGQEYVRTVFVHCSGDDLKQFSTGRDYVISCEKRPDTIKLSGAAYDQYDFAKPYVSELLTRLRSGAK